ncbi:DUF805 domain-containing protein [Jannaschia seohaensis]|uniref:Uncharacterized protein DUF805 n=1 Tax=Jannaschia seohaensis TaxID=475081 RepID=A0A2Y9A1N5_9RHOB|nr:DUF805 domain-containing protein [Jannaschia seohaensis]PWJ22072.1 uncharacterized protein DUF805 [Jannaschia seohaensis]SSA38350.1 Protein of unknown function [Jannaschia seohaensis]
MDFMTAVRTCLTEKYATFQGRASRPEYWWFFLFGFVVMLVLNLIWWPLYLVVALALLCPGLAVGFRRLQDTGRPGWWIVIPFGLSLLTSFFAPSMPDPGAMDPGQMPGMGQMGNVAIFSILGIVQFVVTLLYLWWLTRPSEKGPNAYGPPPAS